MLETRVILEQQPPGAETFIMLGDHRASHVIPDDVLDFMWHLHQQGIPDTVELIVLCNLPTAFQSLMRVMHRLYPTTMTRYRYANTLDNALQIIQETSNLHAH